MDKVLHISINDLTDSPSQGRLIDTNEFENIKSDLTSLKQSIEDNGLLAPVIVRANESGYEVIDGHRRVEIFRQLGKEKIECIIKNYTDREAQVMSVIANLQRKNLSNIEKAIAFKKVLEQGVFKNRRELSKAIGKDETYVGDLINAANMDQRIIDDLLTNKTTNDVRLLRAIRKVEKVDENQQSEKQWKLYEKFISEGLSRSDIQNIVKTKKEKPEKNYSVKLSNHKLLVELHDKISKEKREMIRKMLEEKIEEILKFV